MRIICSIATLTFALGTATARTATNVFESRALLLALFGLAGSLAITPGAHAQERPYIGLVYPTGGQQGTTFQIKVCGSNLSEVHGAQVSGTGVSVKVLEYFRRLEFQDLLLLRDQIVALTEKAKGTPLAALMASRLTPDMMAALLWPPGHLKLGSGAGAAPPEIASLSDADKAALQLVDRIQRKLSEHVETPAYASLSRFVKMEIAIAPDARPGPREFRLVTLRGISNPLVFHVGQLPEFTRKPMLTDKLQVIGKEHLALRKRADDEIKQRITLPCTVNGQIASGEVNLYVFEARKGQRLVITTEGRQLVPYIADAVPGWFQPVLTLYDARGKELAFNDDYRFKPDPVILFEVPQDGEYAFAITDALYRGREDFVYRVTIGAVPFITGIFPLGGRKGALPQIQMEGCNLGSAKLMSPAADAKPGIHLIAVRDQEGRISNRVPFAVDTLPEVFEEEPNNDPAHAQKVTLPVIINGRINRAEDGDVFHFTGRAGDTVVAEVQARQLDSPLDSLLKISDARGNLVALNDDCEALGSGLNTHHADSYVRVKLTADGIYCVHLGDTHCHGGAEYTYRLRISPPQPDFALRIAPSSASIRSKGFVANHQIHVLRKDGFSEPIKIGLKNPPVGISSFPVTSRPPQQPGVSEVVRFGFKTELHQTGEPLTLTIEGRAMLDGREITREAVPAEDKIQAFLWRHLVPAEDFKLMVFDPTNTPPLKRIPPPITPELLAKARAGRDPLAKFDQEQTRYRRWVLNHLYEENLITEDLYAAKIAECEASR